MTNLSNGATTALTSKWSGAVEGHHSLWALCSCMTRLSLFQVHL